MWVGLAPPTPAEKPRRAVNLYEIVGKIEIKKQKVEEKVSFAMQCPEEPFLNGEIQSLTEQK